MKTRTTLIILTTFVFLGAIVFEAAAQRLGGGPPGPAGGPGAGRRPGPGAPGAGPHARRHAPGPLGRRPALPAWLRPGERPLRPLHPLTGPSRTVYVGGAGIQVAEPTTLVIAPPTETPSSTLTAVPAEARTPFVEFARIAEQRAKDFAALSESAARSPDGITELEGSKFCKAYRTISLSSFEVQADATTGQHTGKITYATSVMVQVADTKEAVTATAGYPDENSKPQVSSESYTYQGGRWVPAEANR